MKTVAEIEKDITTITMKIHAEFPELVQFITEMPVKISEEHTDVVNKINLQDYYKTLEHIVSEYAKSHLSSNVKNDPNISSFEAYPIYPPSEDIYNQGQTVTHLDLNDPSINKVLNVAVGLRNEKDFQQDMSGDDLDIPGSELDDKQESVGSEDEENNYYSLGGDNHNDLEEDNG